MVEGSGLGLVAGFFLTVLLVPLVMRLWKRFGSLDGEISLRKIHGQEVPRVGGIVMLLGLLGVFATAELAFPSVGSALFEGQEVSSFPWEGVFAGAGIVVFAGLWDDIFGLSARWKLLLQLAAACTAVGLGVHWPALNGLMDRNLVTFALTALFLVAATNAVNILDGLDGLAGGVLALVFSALLAVGFIHHAVVGGSYNGMFFLFVSACVGVLCGFLFFNRHPARIFMGDSGSYLFGFLAAALWLQVLPVRPRHLMTNLSIPLFVLALPLLDMSLAIVRRAVRGQPIFRGDADHIHHRLLARGMSQTKVAWTLWAVHGIFVCLGLSTVIGISGQWTFVGAIAGLVGLSMVLGYHRVIVEQGFFGTQAEGSIHRSRIARLHEAIANLGQLSTSVPQSQRWQCIAQDLELVLEELGVRAFELRQGQTTLLKRGARGATQVWLALRIPDRPGEEHSEFLELRLFPKNGAQSLLRPDRQQLLEDLLSGLSGNGDGMGRFRSAYRPDESLSAKIAELH